MPTIPLELIAIPPQDLPCEYYRHYTIETRNNWPIAKILLLFSIHWTEEDRICVIRKTLLIIQDLYELETQANSSKPSTRTSSLKLLKERVVLERNETMTSSISLVHIEFRLSTVLKPCLNYVNLILSTLEFLIIVGPTIIVFWDFSWA